MEIKKVSVLGTGIMGRQITQHAAMRGFEVSLVSARRDPKAVQDALDAIRENLKTFFVSKGKMTPAEMQAVLSRIKGYTDLKKGVAGTQVVIENVREDLELKRQTFKELDEVCAPETILATNSSGLMISVIGALTHRQDRIIGTHFFTPVALMKLIEVVRGAKTSDDTHNAIKDFSARLGKEIITINDSPGYVVSRMFLAMINEGAKMVSEGVCTAEDVDKGCQLGLGHAMGPLKTCDMTQGIEHGMNTWRYMREILGEEYWPCPLIVKMNMAGNTGQPAGKGFYDWSPKTKDTLIIKDAAGH